MMTLEINGREVYTFTDMSVVKSMETVSGAFSITATSDGVINLPIRTGNAARILVDGAAVLTGFVEVIEPGYSNGNHSIAITGRDKTCDIIDSSVISGKEITGTVTLAGLIRRVLQANGLATITVIDQARDVATFTSTDAATADIGESIFAFIERYSRRRQVLLTTNGDGNLVITRAGTTRAMTALNCVVGDTSGRNNILSASAKYDDTSRFHQYTVQSQLNVSGLLGSGGAVTSADVTSQSGQAIDADIRSTRRLEVKPGTADASTDAAKLAQWAANIRKAKAFTYTATVQGHHQDAAKTRLWTINELVSVTDDFLGVRADLLVNRVTYKTSLDAGNVTELQLIKKGAYTLEAEQNARDAATNQIGAGILP